MIAHCLIEGNQAPDGGGVHYVSSSIILTNSTIIGNSAVQGGAISAMQSTATIQNCTISINSALGMGGGIYMENDSTPITNSIFWDDSPDEIFGSPVVTYCDIEGGWEGEGNINSDPRFRFPSSEGDFHLMSTDCDWPFDSPCIDAGHPDSLDVLLDCDNGLGTGRCDMGAYGGRNADETTGTGEGRREGHGIPKSFALSQNYPNPFNPTTTITFAIPGNADILTKLRVTLTIYDIRGRQIRRLIHSELDSGSHRVVWNGLNDENESVSSGVYLYTLRSSERSITRKMVLLR